MEATAFIIAAVVVAAFGGPTWAWLTLGIIGVLGVAVEAGS